MKMLALIAMTTILIAQAVLDYRRGRRDLAFSQRYWVVALVALMAAYSGNSVGFVAVAALFVVVGIIDTRRALAPK